MTDDPGLDEEIERSADPAAVRLAVARVADRRGDLQELLAQDRGLGRAFVAVTAASRSLTRLLEADARALDVLAALGTREPLAPTADERELASWQRREFLRIAARDLVGMDALEHTGGLLANLVDDVVDRAWRIVGEPPLAVIGMGKLAGRELNYSSDVDIVFVGDGVSGARVARRLADIVRASFRVDLDLRPEGRDGALVRSVDSYRAYWARWAHPWEFQALLKSRAVGGDVALGRDFTAAASEALWGRTLDAEAIRSLRELKTRAETEMTRSGLADREIKRAAGGIRDIEFAIQLLQLVHGRADPALRTPTTLDALGELAGGEYVDRDDAARLDVAYRFLRRVEHALQLEDEIQTHTLPAAPPARTRLARVLGYRGSQAASSLDQFEEDLARHRAEARRVHERLYFRPLLEALAGAGGRLTDEAAVTRLDALGFTDAERTRQAVRELTRGLTRSSRLMQQLLPLLFDWLGSSPDPDLGLLALRKLASGQQRAMELARAFRESAETASNLCRIIGTSRLLGDVLGANPDLIERLAHPGQLATRRREELVASASTALGWRDEVPDRQRALKRWKNRHLLGVGSRDILAWADTAAVGTDLTAIAEASIEAALAALAPRVSFAVVALGRFAGAELSYASDLDVLFVFDGDGAGAFTEAERVATALLRFLGGSAPADRIWELDAGLRPEGRQGALARSLDGYRTYLDRWARTWERQALLRARPVAGDAALGRAFVDLVGTAVWDPGVSAEQVRDVRRMKARIEAERIPAGEDPEFHLKLGPGSLSDVEFCVQLLQWQHGIREPSTAEALRDLLDVGAITPDDARVLGDAYGFCEHTRNRLFLVRSTQGDSLPQRHHDLLHLARSLETTPSELRDTYRRLTRRSRRVVERLFYGQT